MQTLNKIRTWAETSPDRIAYEYGHWRLTYGALWKLASDLAGALAGLETRRVILYGQKEPELIAGMLGCLLSGKAYVPVTDTIPRDRFLQICTATGAGLVLSEGEEVDCGLPWRSAAGLIAEAAVSTRTLPSAKPEDTAYIMFTSGSTGVPKGVPISRENLDHFTGWISGLQGLKDLEGGRVLNQAGFSFDLSVADLYFSLCGGHTLVGLPTELTGDPAALYAFLRRSACHLMVCTPTFLKLCLLAEDFDAAHISTLGFVYSCGEPLERTTAARLLARFPDCCLINAYGPTEATSAVCGLRITKQMTESEQLLPVGRISTAACTIEIRDGEIVLQGKSVFSGYLNADNSNLYPEKGIYTYRTGDLGRIRDDLLYCLGRKDRQVKWMGYRIEPEELECHLAALPEVEACAVIPKLRAGGTVQMLQAYVVLRPGGTPEQVKKALSAKVPAYMIPKRIISIPSMPVNQNGKTDRKALEEIC